jgi:hypothetical protein
MADNIVTVESVGYIQKTIVEVISMRDQFAMAALTGMIADPNGPDYRSVPKKAYEMADAMLEARKVKK